jgi:hypothetical protein
MPKRPKRPVKPAPKPQIKKRAPSVAALAEDLADGLADGKVSAAGADAAETVATDAAIAASVEEIERMMADAPERDLFPLHGQEPDAPTAGTKAFEVVSDCLQAIEDLALLLMRQCGEGTDLRQLAQETAATVGALGGQAPDPAHDLFELGSRLVTGGAAFKGSKIADAAFLALRALCALKGGVK